MAREVCDTSESFFRRRPVEALHEKQPKQSSLRYRAGSKGIVQPFEPEIRSLGVIVSTKRQGNEHVTV
jgi:hypothetical protein